MLNFCIEMYSLTYIIRTEKASEKSEAFFVFTAFLILIAKN